jgi:hypothetical protein
MACQVSITNYCLTKPRLRKAAVGLVDVARPRLCNPVLVLRGDITPLSYSDGTTHLVRNDRLLIEAVVRSSTLHPRPAMTQPIQSIPQRDQAANCD